mmetsp:Transcript_9644/g.28777  ORF Transcript_9644/g.28777 Transcript_9644/m.28777 type:complete len:171 (+) Transcript_9644:708-1220(+)
MFGFLPNLFSTDSTPSVHGLWPQVDKYGTSQCIKPKDESDPNKIYKCYIEDDHDTKHELQFESHEWEKHGRCAGVSNADEFFTLVCNLSKDPLAVMTKVREENPSEEVPLENFAEALKSGGWPVYSIDEYNKQIQLSACASERGDWKLVNVSDFVKFCGSKSNSNAALSK